jgi:cyclin-dependent kinase-like
MHKYRILAIIGEGTYGKVFKAQSREDGRVVAIKKFKQDEEEDPHVRKTMMREIKVLKEFRHVNIVNLRDVFREKGKLFLIFDYVEKTLLEELQLSPSGLKMQKIKEIIYQILSANHFLHSSNIIHRDIKPENLLISKHGVVKLCDFGFARQMKKEPGFCYTDYVSTRWYRAPELLVGDAAYNESVDVWAIGCIFAEIYNGMPLFPGDSDLHTLQLILETITADDMESNRPI